MRQMELNPTYQLVTAPTQRLMSTEELTSHLNLDCTEADLLDQYLETATHQVETDLQMFLRPAQLRLQVDSFPYRCNSGHPWDYPRRPLFIERSPVTEVTGISYVSADGETVTADLGDFDIDLASRPARIVPARGNSWPSVRRQQHAVSVDFDVGFPTTWISAGTHPPKEVAIGMQAIRMLVGHWVANRETVLVGSGSKEIEFSYTSLLDRIRF